MTDNSEIKTLLLAPDDYNPSFLARWWNAWGEAEKGAVNRLRVIDKTIVDLYKLQRHMRVFDRALAHPPEGATEEDMLTARMKLDEAIPAEVRALQSLSKLGVEMVPYNHKDWHNPSLRVRMAIDKEKKKV